MQVRPRELITGDWALGLGVPPVMKSVQWAHTARGMSLNQGASLRSSFGVSW